MRPAGELPDEVRQILAAGALNTRTAVRLRPVPERGLLPEASKIGGLPAWPADEPWPTLSRKGVQENYVSVVQLHRNEFPEISFPERAEFLQVVWAPHCFELAPEPRIIWREPSAHPLRVSIPEPLKPEHGTVLRECSLHPERVEDYPSETSLDPAWALELHEREPELAEELNENLCAPGSKVAGYPHWLQEPEIVLCSCRREMEHLLTLATWEFEDAASRWDYSVGDEIPSWHAPVPGWITGLDIGDCGYLYFFYCTACPSRPTHMVVQSL